MKLIVALHGFLGQPSDFDFLKNSFEGQKKTHLWVPNLFSSESELSPKLPMDEWASIFNRSVLNLGKFNKRVLIGYSMGGRLAAQALHKSPSIWDQALLLACNPLSFSEEEKTSRGISDRNWADRFISEKWEELVRAWDDMDVFSYDTAKPPIRIEGDFHRKLLAEALQVWSPSKQMNLDGTSGLNSEKVDWVVGLQDQKYLAIQERISEKFPRGNFLQVPGGHRLLNEQSDWVLDWLNKI